jgi:hypothetical protein
LTWYVHRVSDGIAPKPGQPAVVIFSALGHLLERSTANVTVFGFLPVVPMVLGSAVVMVLVSWLTPPPSRATIEKYFPGELAEPARSRARDVAGVPQASAPSR